MKKKKAQSRRDRLNEQRRTRLASGQWAMVMQALYDFLGAPSHCETFREAGDDDDLDLY